MASYVVNLSGGGQMTVNASDPSAAVANVIAQGGTPAAGNTVQTVGSASSGQTPGFNKALTTAFVILVLCGIAIAVSGWKDGAHIVQFGLVIAIVIVIIRDEPQIAHFLGFLNPGGGG